MATLTKTKATKGTWLGRTGTSTEHLFQSSPLGKRVVVHIWDDCLTVAELHAMKGSFWRYPTGHTFEQITLVGKSADQILAEVHRMAEEHFS